MAGFAAAATFTAGVAFFRAGLFAGALACGDLGGFLPLGVDLLTGFAAVLLLVPADFAAGRVTGLPRPPAALALGAAGAGVRGFEVLPPLAALRATGTLFAAFFFAVVFFAAALVVTFLAGAFTADFFTRVFVVAFAAGALRAGALIAVLLALPAEVRAGDFAFAFAGDFTLAVAFFLPVARAMSSASAFFIGMPADRVTVS